MQHQTHVFPVYSVHKSFIMLKGGGLGDQEFLSHSAKACAQGQSAKSITSHSPVPALHQHAAQGHTYSLLHSRGHHTFFA